MYLRACEACRRVKHGHREKKGRGAGWLILFVLLTKPGSEKYPTYQEGF